MRPAEPSGAKILDLVPLTARLEAERRAGRSIVFTNGCFDLLHIGHLHVLEAAAAEGDRLVVGLNGDASVRRLKGPTRPLLPFDERALLLAGLRVVDWVVGFQDDTPAALIEAIRPDVLVKGGDWAPDQIVGREIVEAAGGRVVRVPPVAGSTTNLLRRIRSGP